MYWMSLIFQKLMDLFWIFFDVLIYGDSFRNYDSLNFCMHV